VILSFSPGPDFVPLLMPNLPPCRVHPPLDINFPQLEQIHMQSPAIFASLNNPGHFNSHSNHPGYARNHEFDHRIPPPNRMMGMGMGMGIGMSVGPGGVMMGKGFSGANGLITPGKCLANGLT